MWESKHIFIFLFFTHRHSQEVTEPSADQAAQPIALVPCPAAPLVPSLLLYRHSMRPTENFHLQEQQSPSWNPGRGHCESDRGMEQDGGTMGSCQCFPGKLSRAVGWFSTAIPKARKAALGMKSECIISTSLLLPRRFKLSSLLSGAQQGQACSAWGRIWAAVEQPECRGLSPAAARLVARQHSASVGTVGTSRDSGRDSAGNQPPYGSIYLKPLFCS